MWRSLWLLAIVVNAALAAPPSAGPVSEQEASILWKDGREELDAGKLETGSVKLERLIARYPAYPGYLEAHLLLARAYLGMGEATKAKPLLKHYVQANRSRGNKPEAARGRAELMRAHLALGQRSEALLVGEEAARGRFKGDEEIHVPTLTLKARALMELGHDKRSELTLASARREATAARLGSRAMGELAGAELSLKLRHCAKFPGKPPLDEAQVRDQLSRRGACLLEALVVFREQLAAGDGPSSELATRELIRAYDSYQDACAHPPAPPPLTPKDRTPRQLQAYLREISSVLAQDCRQKVNQGRETLKGWATSLPEPASRLVARATAQLGETSR